MKKIILSALMYMAIFFRPVNAKAQIPAVSAFTGLIKKVIVAIDLGVQRLQNKTIALQNAQQQIEKTLHLNSLNDISGWLDKERNLYANYYQELAKVKKLLADYQMVKDVVNRQKQLLAEYRQASALFNRDAHFSAAELRYMGTIYEGILQESLRNLEAVTTAVTSRSTQMDDADRWLRIDQAAKAIQLNLDHLRQFNRQNVLLSLSRARDDSDRSAVQRLYGLHD
ncbi:conjugal transfer protein TraI [Mucilaginibacter conchicola]|uniref:Conjugal transfer protein TraI n=1 Tax=Mucilaginibacter conchicola TaxID=2303333 RepID=A0A372NUA6_9SPHI|nr:conjugal transfer protein TraI [Mucilaginibacter conchicola]RFZ92838.1 conjugal transfer protein TraI [Mucilaginibacter conchicola]